LPLALPAPRLQGSDGGVQVGHGQDRHTAWCRSVVGQKEHRPLADPERGDPGPEGIESPDPLGSQHLRVVGTVAVEVRRADVEVLQGAERWRHEILARFATVRSFPVFRVEAGSNSRTWDSFSATGRCSTPRGTTRNGLGNLTTFTAPFTGRWSLPP